MKKLVEVPAGLTRLSFICVAVLCVSGCAWKWRVGSDSGPSAKVVALKGAARYATGANAGHMVRLGDAIKPGVFIQTASQSQLDLVLRGDRRSRKGAAPQDLVRMRENSLLRIDTLTRRQAGTNLVDNTRLYLRAGSIYCVVQKLRSASSYQVELPNGVAGTRGAVCDISAEGVVKVFVGTVALGYIRTDRSIDTELIAASQQFDPRIGALASIPESGATTLAAEGP